MVGDPRDPHVASVADVLSDRGHSPLILDLESVMGDGVSIGERGYFVRVEREWIDLKQPRAGWLRRYHRADWGLGTNTGSVKALELGTWFAAYTWLIDSANVSWLTEPRELSRAESKLRQWQAALRLGIPYPRTLVTTSADVVAAEFSGEVIVKPLGTGQFIDGGEVKTVYAAPMMPDDDRLKALAIAPFIVQERLRAARHWRVVTVGDRIWATDLQVDATAPADWRKLAANHTAFQAVDSAPTVVRDRAVAIARDLDLGFSSQDWIQTGDGEMFLVDVNPAGQWLFLPTSVGKAVAEAIADLLLVDR